MSKIIDLSDQKIKLLLKRLEKVKNNIDKIIKEIAATSETSNVFWSAINVRLRKEYEAARNITRDWINKNVPDIYAEQLKDELVRIKNMRLPAPKRINYKDFAATHTFTQSSASLLSETLSTFAIGFNSGEKTLLRLASLTQQVNLSEKAVEKAITEGFIEKGSIYGSKKRLQKELLKKSLDGKYITVVNKNGKETQWQIKTYSELVAKTKLHEASTQGVIDSAMAVGGDLVQVSSHNTNTAYDAQFEGKIFSLSGSSKQFPVATDLPPFHPNCWHTISIVFRESLAQQGTLADYISFSNGESEIHPTRKSFIPLSKREFAA